MRITIKIPPTSNGKWLLLKGSGGHPLKKKSATYTFLALERFLVKSLGTKKMENYTIKVLYPDKMKNETLPSKDIRYLLYATACFMEDWLPEKTLNDKYKKYDLLC